MALLEIENIVSGYGKLAIVQDVSLNINEGDFLAIVGPNGSGKSTLIKTILGLTTVFEGKIRFQGTDITGRKPENIARMRIGYVPQVSNVFADMSVMENLELGVVANQNGSNKKQLLEKVVQLFPILRAREKQKAGSLSGGERQMLAIGRALMAQPKLLFLDEPTAALAPIVAEQVFRKLVEIREMGVTLAVVEQNARKALSLANRGMVLVQGKKAFEGTPDEISHDEKIIKLFLGELSI